MHIFHVLKLVGVFFHLLGELIQAVYTTYTMATQDSPTNVSQYIDVSSKHGLCLVFMKYLLCYTACTQCFSKEAIVVTVISFLV